MTSRIAAMLHDAEARGVTIAGNRVSFHDEAWRTRTKSLASLCNRGTLDVEPDGTRVRVRYRFSTSHMLVLTVAMVGALGAIVATAAHGPLPFRLRGAAMVMALDWPCLFGLFFFTAKIYVPLWLRQGLRDLPDLRR